MLQQCIDAVDVEVGTHIPLVLDLGVAGLVSLLAFPHCHYLGKLSSTTSAAHPGQSTARSGAPDQVPRFDPLTHHQGQFSCLVQVKCLALSPNCCRGMWGRGGQISCSHTLRTGSSAPPNNRSAPLCSPGLQSLLFCHAGTL